MRRNQRSERGAAALMVAGALGFLFGMAALAVDTSDFYQTARVGQTTADLACLAGVSELPDDSAAIDMAVKYTKANWAHMSSAAFTSTGPHAGTLTDGNGNLVTYETNYSGDPDAMRVAVTERAPTTFGRVLGTESVDVAQEAACQRHLKLGGPGALPMGALPGTFSGDLFDCAAKITGNCGALDAGSGADDWANAIGEGWDQQLQKHHGNQADVDSDTGNAVIDCPTSGPCSAIDTEAGNMVGKFRSGTTDRLSVPGICTAPGPFNCDSMSDIFGSAPVQLEDAFGSEPAWWEASIYGPFADATALGNHYYFAGDIPHCDSPRLARVPIVVHDLDWDIDDPATTWPPGKKALKVIGFYTVYIREPDTLAEVGSGPYQADIVFIGAGSTCDGEPFDLYNSAIPIEAVKLVAS